MWSIKTAPKILSSFFCLFLSLYAFIRKLSGLIVYANADANADAYAMHVIVIVIAIAIVIVIVIANSLCSSKDE